VFANSVAQHVTYFLDHENAPFWCPIKLGNFVGFHLMTGPTGERAWLDFTAVAVLSHQIGAGCPQWPGPMAAETTASMGTRRACFVRSSVNIDRMYAFYVLCQSVALVFLNAESALPSTLILME
jgi:hypothetical protein